MRLFIAVNFNDETKDRLHEIQEQLRSQSTNGNFTRRENLHLTLAFLGETPEEKLGHLIKIIDEVIINEIKPPPFEVCFNTTGCFTHGNKDLWWIGAERNTPGLSHLEAIHSRLIDRLSEEGFSVDRKPFSAHITIAREITHKQKIILDRPDIVIGIDRISLMKSEHIRGLLTYTEI